jgi:hypothetical protein
MQKYNFVYRQFISTSSSKWTLADRKKFGYNYDYWNFMFQPEINAEKTVTISGGNYPLISSYINALGET